MNLDIPDEQVGPELVAMKAAYEARTAPSVPATVDDAKATLMDLRTDPAFSAAKHLDLYKAAFPPSEPAPEAPAKSAHGADASPSAETDEFTEAQARTALGDFGRSELNLPEERMALVLDVIVKTFQHGRNEPWPDDVTLARMSDTTRATLRRRHGAQADEIIRRGEAAFARLKLPGWVRDEVLGRGLANNAATFELLAGMHREP